MKKIPEGDEYQEALEDLYKDIKKVKKLADIEKSFTKKDKKGKKNFDKDAYVEYLKSFLTKREKVSEKELVQLAKTRVTNMSNYLIETKKVNKDAVIIQELTKQEKKDAKWVVFNLDVSTK